MSSPVPKENIKGLECKHAVYVNSNYPMSQDDMVVVKEVIHTKDGELVPNLRFFRNYKRPFYITRELHRNHTEKKEWEKLSRLQKFECQQNQLLDRISRALGRGKINGGLRAAGRNPYLYGADITTPTLIKQMYRDKWPTCVSDNRVAVFDIETDVVHGTNEPIYMALTFKNKAFLAVTKFFLGSTINPVEKLHQKFEEYLGEYKEKRNIELEVMVVNDPATGVIEAFKRAHEWKPDFVSIWNIDFDIPRVTQTLINAGYDPAEVFSDPSVPPEFRFFKYKQGPSKKQTASGQVMTIHPAERWHVAECPATFFLIDSMCVYKRIRMAKQNETSYALDAILNKHLKLGKLKFEEADGFTGLKWHQVMQSDYKIEYGIYNLFDCIGVELLDEKTKDLSQIISTQSKSSEYTIFNSQPKRLVDDLYFFCRDRGLVPSSCSDDMVHELDAEVVGLKNWIVTLPSHLTVDNGLPLLEELPDVRSHCRAHVADLD